MVLPLLLLGCVWGRLAVAAATAADLPDAVVPLDIDETSIAAGIEHSCAIRTQSYEDVGGRVVCWGVNNGGQSSPPPGDFIQVSTGRLHSCGIRIDETLECWGVGAPVTNPEGLYEQVSSGDFHSCGIMKDQTVHCWGAGGGGGLHECMMVLQMDKTVTCWGMRSGVTAAPTNVQFDELTLGWNHGCGIRFEDGGVQCWGDRGSNRLDIPDSLL
ncbi:unnamed protein product [Phytophthora fragariaefolia]|uniref:non-specific serine/threonine protein kinase n=1 Tax=Phytophthora fragariaefolia TaxID=1490495 RepID=A0A9W6YII5_9STRA|nr:unnamed protein product [Phytophthora fragariaefolia]